MNGTDFTTAPKIQHEILDGDGDTIGMAPGIDARDALETFNRDALENAGQIGCDDDEVWQLHVDGDILIAQKVEEAGADLENGPSALDGPTPPSLAELQAEKAKLEEIFTVKTSAATRDLVLARLQEIRGEIRAAAATAPARETQPNYGLIDERILEHGLPLGIEEAGDETTASGLWYRAVQALEVEWDGDPDSDAEAPTQLAAAQRVADAYAVIYGMAAIKTAADYRRDHEEA